MQSQVINGAIETCVPKIKARTLQHPEIDRETRSMIEEARRTKVQMVNGIDYVNNRRRLTALRERIRERCTEKRNQMWRDLVTKVDTKRTPKELWKDIGRMMGRRKTRTEIMKNENGADLKSGEEIERDFRARLERTFRITQEENEEFCEENDRMVEEWARQKREDLEMKNRIDFIPPI